ncbi:MAG TPA: hypothetical protein ENK08_10185 [Chloroflexi bacterium]|nr:hypothetical protein [Chloroflexota bacterium]
MQPIAGGRRPVTEGEGRGKVLLVAADWRTRALLLAELKEAGYDVMALPGIRWALAALAGGRVVPVLAVLDVTGDADASPARVRQLLRLLGDAPLVLLVGTYDVQVFAPLRGRVAAWLSRPLRLARVVEAVRWLYPPP